ncbi:MAG: hypothetical protein MHM6MM_004878 [Cercozoa sp. M6MM]
MVLRMVRYESTDSLKYQRKYSCVIDRVSRKNSNLALIAEFVRGVARCGTVGVLDPNAKNTSSIETAVSENRHKNIERTLNALLGEHSADNASSDTFEVAKRMPELVLQDPESEVIELCKKSILHEREFLRKLVDTPMADLKLREDTVLLVQTLYQQYRHKGRRGRTKKQIPARYLPELLVAVDRKCALAAQRRRFLSELLLDLGSVPLSVIPGAVRDDGPPQVPLALNEELAVTVLEEASVSLETVLRTVAYIKHESDASASVALASSTPEKAEVMN